MHKKNYKIFIGIIIGMLISFTAVYAASTYASIDVYYENTNSNLSSDNVQGAIDELSLEYSNLGNECPEDFLCVQLKTTLALGDYVSLTPKLSSFTTSTTNTGYTSTQTINPQELNLWRVIKLNNDGTVDIISEHVSSTSIYFRGLTGYKNLVGYLNVLASKYENSDFTIGSRYFGYNNQTEYITANDNTYFGATPPWTSNTGTNTIEAYGGGDTLYTTDYELINTVLGTRVATNPSGVETGYWMASRYYSYSSSTTYYWYGRYVNISGIAGSNSLYSYRSSAPRTYSIGSTLRPILTLKSGLSYSGVGTAESPIELSLG